MKRYFIILSIVVAIVNHNLAQNVFNIVYDNSDSTGRANAVIQGTGTSFIVVGTGLNVDAFFILKIDSKGVPNWLTVKNWGIGGGDIAYSVIEINNKNYLVCGISRDASDTASVGFLLKLDYLGNIFYEQKYFSINTHRIDFTKVKQTQDKGFVVVARKYNIAINESDFYLMKTDSIGNVEWDTTYGGADYEFCTAIDFTTDSGYILAGTTYSFGLGPYDMYLVKTDSSGKFLWQKTFGSSEADYCTDMITTKDGGYLLVGGSRQASNNNLRAYIVKTNSDGNLEWEKLIDRKNATGDVDELTGVKELPDGNFVACGTTMDYSNGNPPMTMGWLVKFTPNNGNIIWQRNYNYYPNHNDSTHHYFFGMDLSNDGGFVMTGMTIDVYNLFGITGNDAWLVKTDCYGFVENAYPVVADFNFATDAMQATFTNQSDSACWYRWSFGDGDSSTEQHPAHTYADTGMYVVTLISYNADKWDTVQKIVAISITGIKNLNRKEQIIIYPNPITDKITLNLKISEGSNYEFQLFNLVGQLCFKTPVKNKLVIDLSSVSGNGIYFYKIMEDSRVFHKGKIIVNK